MNFKKWNNIIGWALFTVAAIVYLSTMERTLSFWDCGEYIVSSAKLGVTHAPGAAVFQILGAVWSGLSFGDGSLYALLINSLSALCSAFTILFLFWTITHMAKTLIAPKVKTEWTANNKIAIFISGSVGASAFMFSDSFWFSAVEGEVYAMASMFTALMLWLICKWENDFKSPRANRWLVLIALLIGLSTGVHLMAILVVPAICYIYYFKTHEFTWKTFLIANAITLVIFAFVFKVLFSVTMTTFGKLEIFMVNELGMPFNSGSLTAFIIITLVFFFALKYTQQKKLAAINTFVLASLFMLIGFSSWLVIPIRANANPHMNLNNPEDAIGLLNYYNRDQYGDWPVFYGPLYTAHVDPNGVETNPDGTYKMKDDGPVYRKNEKKGKYEIVGRKQSYVYSSEQKGPFARMYNPQVTDNYSIFSEPHKYQAFDPNTGEQTIFYKKPTLWENVQYFLDYQIGYMYLRYLGWNFIGKQNDLEGNLEATKGNTKTGFNFIDKQFIGDQKSLPDNLKNNKANNVYFALPLILGLIGFFFQLNRDFGRNFALISLFLLTGVGIALYTNMKPFEPRERDYAFVSSFYTFAIWIGLGVTAIYSFVQSKMSAKPALVIGGITMAIPLLMAFQNWDDHDRSERQSARDLPYNYLVNLDPNSILFVYGDNDTYPLWALQETEQFRDDVKIVNYTLLSAPWNISQVKRKTYNAEGIPSQLTEAEYRQGVNEGILVMKPQMFEQIMQYAGEVDPSLPQDLEPIRQYAENGMTAKEAMIWFLDKNNPTKNRLLDFLKNIYSGSIDNVIPTNKIIVPVNKENVLKYGIVSKDKADEIIPNVVVNIKSSQLTYKSELMMLDILANYNWDRGIYFSSGGLYDDVNIFYLNDYLQNEGFSYKFVPIKTTDIKYGERGTIDPMDMYKQIQNFRWGNFNDPDAYFDETATRNILTYRNSVARTASALADIGEAAKANELLDLLEEKIPHKMYPDGYVLYDLIPIYLKLGEQQKAEELQTFLTEKIQSKLNYYYNLKPRLQATVMTDMSALKGEEQYMASIVVDYYLQEKKDTVKAMEEFKQFYAPIEKRIKEGFADSDSPLAQRRLEDDLSIQRGMLQIASEIDSVYADKKFDEVIDLLEKMQE